MLPWRFDHATAVLVDLTNTPHQTRIRLGLRAWRAILLGVITTGGHFQTSAHQSHRVLIAAAVDHRVPLDDSLAKYAAASLKKITLLNHSGKFTLETSKFLISRTSRAEKGLSPSDCDPRTQRVSRFGATPISRDTCRQLAPELRTSSMASRLNSGLYLLRVDMTTLQPDVSLLESVYVNGVESLFAPCVKRLPGPDVQLALCRVKQVLLSMTTTSCSPPAFGCKSLHLVTRLFRKVRMPPSIPASVLHAFARNTPFIFTPG